MVTDIKLINSSATHPLRIATQSRKHYPVASAPAPRQRRALSEMTATEQAELEKRGEEPVETRVPPPFGSIGQPERVALFPRWQNDGEPTLANWVARSFERRETEAVAAAASESSASGIRLSEEWSDARPFDTVLPRAEFTLRCDDNIRYVFESDDPYAYIHFHNPSAAHWFAARVLDKCGKPSSTAHVGPGQDAPLFLGKHGAVLEQRPT